MDKSFNLCFAKWPFCTHPMIPAVGAISRADIEPGGVDFRRLKQNALAGQQPFAIACESASARLPCIAGTACSV